jgi:hypothetical protein
VSPPGRRPPIGPVLSSIATLLAEWWLGFDATEADEPQDGFAPDGVSSLTGPEADEP